MIVAAAQTIPFEHNTNANIENHTRFIEAAARHGVQLIVFPEMSLTGYDRERADELSFSAQDQRLEGLKEMAVSHKMIIIAGAPIKVDGQLHIGSFIFSPDNTVSIYTKQLLHKGEEQFFSPNLNFNPVVKSGNEKCSLAICADITNPLHPRNAAANKTTLYAASLFYTPNGIADAYGHLGRYAQKYSMNVLMANYGGPSYNMRSAGRSTFWDNKGNLVGNMANEGEGLLIADNSLGNWKTKVLTGK